MVYELHMIDLVYVLEMFFEQTIISRCVKDKKGDVSEEVTVFMQQVMCLTKVSLWEQGVFSTKRVLLVT